LKWNYYLITKLEKQKTEKELLLKECVHREQELEQEYKKSMDENISFSEQEWEEYQLKAKGLQALKKIWKKSV
jgi:hypothetical protein